MASSADRPLRIGVVAGEPSGDLLGAALLEQLSVGGRELVVAGVGGPLMQAAGCDSLYDADRLAVMGLVEPLGRLPELLKMRKALGDYFIANPPDCFIGIDSPDFNLRLERRLKQAGIPTFHYVSPSVWAWRRGRLKLIREAVDGVMTLFPFESQFYSQSQIASQFVGHPSFQRISWNPPKAEARDGLGISNSQRVIALLPGSRGNEYRRLGPLFIDVARQLNDQQPTHFVVPLIDTRARDFIEPLFAEHPELSVSLLNGQSHQAMQAADLVLMASGTASLEAMMMGRPLVVAHKLAELSFQILKRLFYGKWIALPNLLAQRDLVPELIQSEANVVNVVTAINQWFDDAELTASRLNQFEALREQLRGEITPGQAVLNWLEK